MMNSVNLIGRLTKDLELRYAENGTAYTFFTMAVNRDFKKENGQEADFIDCVAFGKTAEIICQYLNRGRQLGVEGNLQSRKTEREGVKYNQFTVAVNRIHFLDSKKEKSNDKEIEIDNNDFEKMYKEFYN